LNVLFLTCLFKIIQWILYKMSISLNCWVTCTYTYIIDKANMKNNFWNIKTFNCLHLSACLFYTKERYLACYIISKWFWWSSSCVDVWINYSSEELFKEDRTRCNESGYSINWQTKLKPHFMFKRRFGWKVFWEKLLFWKFD
jgi:hypothetical protein